LFELELISNSLFIVINFMHYMLFISENSFVIKVFIITLLMN